jgi:hypothetical protein
MENKESGVPQSVEAHKCPTCGSDQRDIRLCNWPLPVPDSPHGYHKVNVSCCTECRNDLWHEAIPVEVPEDEDDEMQILQERDEAQEWGDKLAYKVGEYFGVPVGEHSNCNDPRAVAMDILNGEYKTKFDKVGPVEAPLNKWKKAPDGQAWWWHWNGEGYAMPHVYSVMAGKRGPDERYFVADGKLAPWCDGMGGFWLKVEYPNVPTRDEQKSIAGAQPLPAPTTAHTMRSAPMRFICGHGDFAEPCKICQGNFHNSVFDPLPLSAVSPTPLQELLRCPKCKSADVSKLWAYTICEQCGEKFDWRFTDMQAEIDRLNDEIKRRDNCSFKGPMRDCPTHGIPGAVSPEPTKESYRAGKWTDLCRQLGILEQSSVMMVLEILNRRMRRGAVSPEPGVAKEEK